MKKLIIYPLLITAVIVLVLNVKVMSQNVGDERMSARNEVSFMSVIGNLFCKNCPISLDIKFVGKKEVYKEVNCGSGGCNSSNKCYSWVEENTSVPIEFKLYKDGSLFKTKVKQLSNSHDDEKHNISLNQLIFEDITAKFEKGKYKLSANLMNTQKILEDEFTVLVTGDNIKLIFSKTPDYDVEVLDQSIGITPDNIEGSCKLSSCLSPASKCIEITKAGYSLKPGNFYISGSSLKYYDLYKTFSLNEEKDFPISDLYSDDGFFLSTVYDAAPNHPIKEKFLAGKLYTWEYYLLVKCQ